MNAQTAFNVYRALLDAAPGRLDDTRRSQIGSTLDDYASLVPEPAAWAVQGSASGAMALLLADDTLFLLELTLDGEQYMIAAESRPLQKELGPVSLAPTQSSARLTHGTRWTFHLQGDKTISVEGTTNTVTGEPNRSEVFARALASRFGWTVAGGGV